MLNETIAAIHPVDETAMAAARAHQDRLTKPRGSLGALEDVATRLAGIAGFSPPPLPQPVALAIFAADHGVHAQGVSPWPQEVTAQMVANFLSGGAVANAFAAQAGASVTVVDVGVATDLDPLLTQIDRESTSTGTGTSNLLDRRTAPGTADLSQGPAMTEAQAITALTTGIEVARTLIAQGSRCLITGDMGIANTTASAALVSAFTGRPPAEVTGRGTGIDDPTLHHKIDIVRQALQANEIHPDDEPLRILSAVGGFEHAAIAGFILGAAAERVPVVLDGVIAGSAALAAAALAPDAVGYCVAGHRSAEPGHTAALDFLGLRPLVDLELRLGEGSGGLLAYPLVLAAVRVLHDVATFDSAGVTDKAGE
ncbi:nicotinate-nucleotide--dimethylbenzimidazole phosphoribosyltransferase [Acrocarpospora catenulata]|uniref:nicotinate-nucleotide--dimethylbenzimidazole phosphoribosyltransferase n=1 Tax=Acrocarpospora catenulata TaxID=2836182 RepID=UPI001BDA8322|nr:nicotinate-nucleotide--dimethylbenzimidazole phosphoribosyltransferase [Acrocarpospora catenulata]